MKKEPKIIELENFFEFYDLYSHTFLLEDSFLENWGPETCYRTDISWLWNNNSSGAGSLSALQSSS